MATKQLECETPATNSGKNLGPNDEKASHLVLSRMSKTSPIRIPRTNSSRYRRNSIALTGKMSCDLPHYFPYDLPHYFTNSFYPRCHFPINGVRGDD